MAKYAVLTEDQLYVENIIILDESQVESMEQALGRKLLDSKPLGLAIDDFYNGTAWTRNVDGEQVILPVGDSQDAEEILAILLGLEDDENGDI